MEVICMEEGAFYALIEHVVKRLQNQQSVKEEDWVNDKEAMRLLNIKSRATLQKLRDEGKISFSQPMKKIILYDRMSIKAYIQKHVHKAF